MYATGPALRGAHRPVAVTAVGRRVFDGDSPLAADPEHHRRHGDYLRDMLAPYGTAPDDVTDGRGHSYGEMAHALIADSVPADAPADLLVLAFAVPDIAPGRATATYLSHVCPGTPTAFAISDQGTATAHTALRIVREYVSGGACKSGLLLVVEQAALHHEPLTPAPVPTRHTAVLLRVDAVSGSHPGTATPAGRIADVRQHTGVDPDAVAALLAAETAALSAGHDDVTVLLGELLADAAGPVPGARIADAGSPYTGMWWELAAELAAPQHARRVLAADYDPVLRILSVTAADVAARRPSALVAA
jgi:hypothetical protein